MFTDRLRQRCQSINSHLCVGIDPRPDRFPREFSSDDPLTATRKFSRELIELTAPFTAAYKFQSAFFEVLGHGGSVLMEELGELANSRGALTIADVKRGDIGSTAAAYAACIFGSQPSERRFDSMTVNPWFGTDGLEPFFKSADRSEGAVFLLVKTSNPSSAELLDVKLDSNEGGGTLFERVADLTRKWSDDRYPGQPENAAIGAVVGATHGDLLSSLRKRMPHTWFLVPGVGAQGATMRDAAHAFDEKGSRALVALSRGISEPWGSEPEPDDWRRRIADATERWCNDLQEALVS